MYYYRPQNSIHIIGDTVVHYTDVQYVCTLARTISLWDEKLGCSFLTREFCSMNTLEIEKVHNFLLVRLSRPNE